MIEIRSDSEAALSDGEQSLLPEKFESLVTQMRAVAAAIGKTV